ncbi:MAG TPA: hypothetical protein VGE01_15065 [Fimbriimonas sp.]
MFILLEGEIRRRKMVGFGPFRKTRWESEPFSVRLTRDGQVEEVEDCQVERLDKNGRIYLNAKVNGIPCYLADFGTEGTSNAVDFNMLSVAGIEVRGKAALVTTLSNPQSESQDRYVA